MSRLLLIDNYDSFTYNLYQYLCELGADVTVVRNDAITVDDVARIDPDGIVLSPGPGRPEDAGVCIPVIERYVGQKPILGVCLGHQAIAAAYGATIVGAPELLHGKTSFIHHDGAGLYEGMKPEFQAVRYHSLVADRKTLPDFLIVDSETSDGIVMGVHHRDEPLFGVQFHPESILTDGGKILLRNFLDVVAQANAQADGQANAQMTGQPVALAASAPAGR